MWCGVAICFFHCAVTQRLSPGSPATAKRLGRPEARITLEPVPACHLPVSSSSVTEVAEKLLSRPAPSSDYPRCDRCAAPALLLSLARLRESYRTVPACIVGSFWFMGFTCYLRHLGTGVIKSRDPLLLRTCISSFPKCWFEADGTRSQSELLCHAQCKAASTAV